MKLIVKVITSNSTLLTDVIWCDLTEKELRQFLNDISNCGSKIKTKTSRITGHKI